MATVKVIKPGGLDFNPLSNSVKVFLAGSIEMGKAIDWQTAVSDKLQSLSSLGGFITIFNPRRDSWDLSWEQTENNPEFRNQVNWELNKLEESHIIFLIGINSASTGIPAGLSDLMVCDSNVIVFPLLIFFKCT